MTIGLANRILKTKIVSRTSAQWVGLLLASCALISTLGMPAFAQKGQKKAAKVQVDQAPNKLTKAERKAGWVSLFDGSTSKGWRGVYKTAFPDSGWIVQEGCLIHKASKGGESNSGGDIITEKQYRNFELELDFNVSEGGNSGIKYFVLERQPRPKGSAIGCEFQILDDERHPDAKKGKDGNRTIGSLYDLITASNKSPNPPGQWNHARLVVKGNEVEHWLNGSKVVAYTRNNEAWKILVAGSKYKDIKDFGESPVGHILLQDHGDLVKFRNIKIKELN